MYSYQTIKWIPLRKEKDEYLLVLINFMEANSQNINRLFYNKFGGHCEPQRSSNNSNYTIFELIVRNNLTGTAISNEQKEFIENIVKKVDKKYRDIYFKNIQRKD